MNRRRLAAALAGLVLFVLTFALLRPAPAPLPPPLRVTPRDTVLVSTVEDEFVEPLEDDEPKWDPSILAGRIVWPDGGPWQGDLVSLAPFGPDGALAGGDLIRIEGGRFRFEGLKALRYEIESLEPDGMVTRSLARWKVDAGREDLVLTIPEQLGHPFVAIRAFDPEERPVASADVRVEVLGDFGGPQEQRRKLVDGWCRFALRMPGDRYLLTVTGGRARDGRPLGAYTAGPVEVADLPFGVALPWERPIRGTVADAETGEPVPGCRVTASLAAPVLTWISYKEGIHEASVETDDLGRFEIPGFGGDELRIHLRPPPPWFAPDPIPLTESDGIRLVVRKGVTPAVTVRGPDGAPVEGAIVRVTDGALAFVEFRTSEKGAARIGPLDPEREHHLDVEGPEGRGEASIPEWRPADVTVVLEGSRKEGKGKGKGKGKGTAAGAMAGDSKLLLEFVNWPAPDVNVTVWSGIVHEDGRPETSRVFEFSPSQFGTEFSIEGLSKDRTYTVAIWGVGPGLAVERKGLAPGPERHVLKLVPGAVVSGRIYLPPGADVAFLGVARIGLDAGNGGVATVLRDGHFEVRGLLPGTWSLNVTVRAGRDWYRSEMKVRTGTPVHVLPRKLGD